MYCQEVYMEKELDLRLTKAVPTERQIKIQQMEFYGFVHFTINTFTGMEWGEGTEDPKIFNPDKLNAEQWARAAKDGGMSGLILTCKHHDGFCLWPSAYTKHSVASSPYKDGKGDIVKELSDACRKEGIKFGVYLSPWDRNNSSYGTGKEYDDYFVNQLTELLTNYGDIFTVWFDGACGEGPNGKVQKYDWDRYYSVIRKLQPKACISVSGPDVRWCGNEAGDTRESEWSVVPVRMSDTEIVAENSQKRDDEEFRRQTMNAEDRDLGSRDRLRDVKNIIWYPAEVDVSIRPGWFYHEEEDDKVRSFENLKDIYLKSVGGNATLLLNIPPDKHGLFCEADVKRLKELGDFIRTSFSDNLVEQAELIATPFQNGHSIENVKEDDYDTYFRTDDWNTQAEIRIKWKEEKKLKYLVMKEMISLSQRIEKFTISYLKDGREKIVTTGTTVGYKKIVSLPEIITDELIIRIVDSRVAPTLSFIGVYGKQLN